MRKAEKYIEQELFKIDQMQDGYAFENYVAALLKSHGYHDVTVTEKSGDYGADIIATLDGKRIAFQCKCSSAPIGVKAVQEVLAGKLYYKCDSAVVVTNRDFTMSALTLAHLADVDLWGRNKLASNISPENSFIDDYDKTFMDAINYALARKLISTQDIQKEFRIGYAKATRIMDDMERIKIVGPPMGNRPRDVLMEREQFSFGVPKSMIEQQKVARANYDFRKIYWGMDKKQVIEQEGKPNLQLPKGAYIYQGYHVIGYDCDYSICFNKSGLAFQGVYMFSLSHDSIPDYVNDFNNICKITSQKYGTPFSQGEDWKNNKSAEAVDKDASFLNGNMEYYAYWQTETTIISLNLYHDKFGVSCLLVYATTDEGLKENKKEEIDLSEI